MPGDRFSGRRPARRAAAGRPPELEFGGAALDDLQEEIKLLRALVRYAVREGQIEAARRLVGTLCAAIRLQHSLGGAHGGDLQRVLDELLEAVDQEQASVDAEAGRDGA